jgi:hypothetical protein
MILGAKHLHCWMLNMKYPLYANASPLLTEKWI